MVVTADGEVAVMLGVAERRQGVRCDWPRTDEMLRRRKAGRAPGDRMLGIAQQILRRLWWEAGLGEGEGCGDVRCVEAARGRAQDESLIVL